LLPSRLLHDHSERHATGLEDGTSDDSAARESGSLQGRPETDGNDEHFRVHPGALNSEEDIFQDDVTIFPHNDICRNKFRSVHYNNTGPGQHSSVGIVTSYSLDGLASIPDRGKFLLFSMSSPALGPTQHSIE
jgi:hypothetical protein